MFEYLTLVVQFHSDSVPSGEIPGVPRVKAACVKALRTLGTF